MPTRPVAPHDDSEDEQWQMMSAYMGVRKRYFDEALLAAGTQIVIVAAGLDCRAFRLPWPDGTTVFGVDQPKVLAFKDEVLAALGATAPCARHVLPMDLRGDWAAALPDAGFDPQQPTAWLAEGLLPYLPPESETALLRRVDELSAPGSSVAVR